MRRQLHPDWPEAELAERYTYDLPTPVDELAQALESASFGSATGPAQPIGPVALAEVSRVVRYAVSWHDGGDERGPQFSGGSELDLALVTELVDGRWISVTGWNDYTGWGCRDGADVRVGDTEEQVVEFGLDESARRRLGYVVEDAAS